MTDSIYHRPLTRALALERLQHANAASDLAMIARRIDRISEWNTDYTYGSIHGALYEALKVCRRTYADATAAVVAVGSLPDRPAALIGRFADRLAWYVFPVRRLTREGDPHAFLARLALSPEMLVQALMCPSLAEIRDSDAILTDPTLSAAQIADAMLSAHPEAARIINARAFSGAPLDLGARRFYRAGDNRHASIQIGDAQTGLIVYRADLDPASADALVAGLETDTSLAERFVDCAKRITHQQWRAKMSRRGLPNDAPRTAETDALDPLYSERTRLIIAAMGEDAYRANEARIQAETQAWIDGPAR